MPDSILDGIKRLTGFILSWYQGLTGLILSWYQGNDRKCLFSEEFLFLAKVVIIPKEELAKYGYKRI
jgi:hypothetical protein